MAQYVYGIVEANATAPRGRGIANAPVKLVVDGGAAALVSEIRDRGVRLGRKEVLTHGRVLERAMARGTVLPMRFGIVMTGPEEIRRRLLEEYGEDLRAQLDALRGKLEVRIRATYDEQALYGEVLRDNPDIATLRHSLRGQSEHATYYERIQLGELVAAAVERRRERDAHAILTALSTAALAVDEAKPGHERVVVNASFLVDREHLEEFNQILDGVADSYGGGIAFKYTGPLPPHSFVQLAEQV